MKKVSKVNQVKEMLANDPNVKVEDVMKVLGVKKSYAYTLLSGAKKAKPKRQYKKREVKAKAREQKEVNSENSLAYIRGLEHAVVKFKFELNKATELNQQLETQNTALKIDMLDQQAIINYLEKKLLK